ncbi:MAG TPA: DUF2071 domain-containing protein [Bryobacteraceae bacterium]|nr:DUF2071 domain-containing protein [Bryobacteraceae bacterium]
MSIFLTAEWRYLAMLNYAVDPALLAALVPPGTELDDFQGKTYVSLVGFRFERTRLRGLWIPFHSDFDEVNLRFYVRRTAGRDVRRGVVFVREIVPRWAIAKTAQVCFGEKYIALPMAHKVVEPTSEGGRIRTEYRFRHGGNWNALRAECGGRPAIPASGSPESFFIEHYWGYGRDRKGATLEYRVEHDRWRTWPVSQAKFQGDPKTLFGENLSRCLAPEPDSSLVAEGSAVTVHSGERILSS